MPLTHGFKETIRPRRSAIWTSVKPFCGRPWNASSTVIWQLAWLSSGIT